MATKAKAAKNKQDSLPVLDREDPWTEEEIAEVRAELEADREAMARSLAESERDLNALLSEGSDGAGRDPVDVGSSNFERDQEMSLHANARDMLEQTIAALRALDEGTYGYCENCGQPIGKARLSAFPRATMCVDCKKRLARH
uniref:TraR/DksA family transcriptional regulator n=1 Tax=Vaginimicrobium propionicum TaxID=1871034 RepID=UPI000970A3D5|nr:TraR/DksA C4-type zinc finger protein [Vaginimicrobium propionicum]